MTTQEQDKAIRYLRTIGMDVFVNILYPALKKSFDIDYHDVCRMYPEYAERAKSDKTKQTRLSCAKSILRNGWEEFALEMITESNRVDLSAKNNAKKYLSQFKKNWFSKFLDGISKKD